MDRAIRRRGGWSSRPEVTLTLFSMTIASSQLRARQLSRTSRGASIFEVRCGVAGYVGGVLAEFIATITWSIAA